MQFIPEKVNFLISMSITHLSFQNSDYCPVRGTLSTSCYTAARRTSSASSARDRCVEVVAASCCRHDGWDGETGSQQPTIRSFV